MAVMAERPVEGRRTSPPELVRLLEVEPDFGIGVDPLQFADARRRTLAPVVTVAPGRWDPSTLIERSTVTGPFAG